MKQLVLASGNPGKLREMRALLAPLALEVVPQNALGITEAEEPHHTFLENALAKARHASRASGLPALADDSGLCVAALGGDPGVHSAYYAGHDGDRETRDARNNAKLVRALEPQPDRRGEYVCVMVLVRHADDPRPIDADSTCPAARDYSRAYLHHLVRSGEYLGAMLMSWINTAFYQELMAAIRLAIEEDRYAAFIAEHKSRLTAAEPA